MKTIIYLLIFTFTLNGFSQDGGKHERIKALKVAFITEKLELSQKEAQEFWPLYNTFDEKEHQYRKEGYLKRQNMNIAAMSEKDAKKIIDDMLADENEKYQLKEKFVKDLLKILPATKVVKLRIAEDEFNKKMLQEYRKRRENHKKDKP